MNDVLRHLADSGIVLCEKRPPSNFYRLNHDHVAAEGILLLAGMSATLAARIRAELENWTVRPQAAWLFGSAARGEGTEQSDIDIFLVLPASDLDSAAVDIWERQTEVLTEKIMAWSGNRCEIVEMEAVELTAAVDRNDLLVRDLREQAVTLAGRDPRDLLGKEFLS
ncbi:MAG TPA: nucleotidyltransferase domain-containing protein [Propionibacteriaceae bacterium]